MNEELIAKLGTLGLTAEQIEKLKVEEVKTNEDMAMLKEADIMTMTGCKTLTARKVVAAFAPAPVPVAAVVAADVLPPDAEIPPGATPSKATMDNFAATVGMDPSIMPMIMMSTMAGGAGMEMDLSGLIPVPQIVAGYNPKVRNLYLMVMTQMEKRLGTPIVIINSDGGVNKELTAQYIAALEEGHDAMPDGVYDDGTNLFEIIKVGVDAKSVYDADPFCSMKALQQNGQGVGRVHWNGVSLEVRQAAYYAVQSGEIDTGNESHMSWARDHINKDANYLVFAGQAPRALAQFREAARTGSLPTLRVMLSRGPRKTEVMARRQRLGDNRPRPTRDRAGLGVGEDGEPL